MEVFVVTTEPKGSPDAKQSTHARRPVKEGRRIPLHTEQQCTRVGHDTDHPAIRQLRMLGVRLVLNGKTQPYLDALRPPYGSHSKQDGTWEIHCRTLLPEVFSQDYWALHYLRGQYVPRSRVTAITVDTCQTRLFIRDELVARVSLNGVSLAPNEQKSLGCAARLIKELTGIGISHDALVACTSMEFNKIHGEWHVHFTQQ